MCVCVCVSVCVSLCVSVGGEGVCVSGDILGTFHVLSSCMQLVTTLLESAGTEHFHR